MMTITRSWRDTQQERPADGVEVEVLNGTHVQRLKRSGNLWFYPDGSGYVYFTPAYWRYLLDADGHEITTRDAQLRGRLSHRESIMHKEGVPEHCLGSPEVFESFVAEWDDVNCERCLRERPLRVAELRESDTGTIVRDGEDRMWVRLPDGWHPVGHPSFESVDLVRTFGGLRRVR